MLSNCGVNMFSLFAVLSSLAIIVYTIGLAIYRLYLGPLANFPGPKLAALTQYYEIYYELIAGGGGKFTHQIKKMHEQYGIS